MDKKWHQCFSFFCYMHSRAKNIMLDLPMDRTKLDICSVTLAARWSVTSGCTDMMSKTTWRDRQAT